MKIRILLRGLAWVEAICCMADLSIHLLYWLTGNPRWLKTIFSPEDLARSTLLLLSVYIITEKP